MLVPKYTKRRTERGELEGLKHSARWSGPPSASDVSLITIRLQVGICPAQSLLEIYHWIFIHLCTSLQSCPLLCVLPPGLYSLDSSHSLGVSNGTEWVEECFWAHWPATAKTQLQLQLRSTEWECVRATVRCIITHRQQVPQCNYTLPLHASFPLVRAWFPVQTYR